MKPGNVLNDAKKTTNDLKWFSLSVWLFREVNDFTIFCVHPLTYTAPLRASYCHSVTNHERSSVWNDAAWLKEGERRGYALHICLQEKANRLLVSGRVWEDLELGPWSVNCEILTGLWNPSLNMTIGSPSKWQRTHSCVFLAGVFSGGYVFWLKCSHISIDIFRFWHSFIAIYYYFTFSRFSLSNS